MDYTKDTCPFCMERNTRAIIAENELTYAAFDIYPVSEGHSLVITKRHVTNFFEITPAEREKLFTLVNEVQSMLVKKYNPDGFNVGVNINTAAGQTVPHVHVHVIPRYFGDMENPRGGVRHVIPEKGNY